MTDSHDHRPPQEPVRRLLRRQFLKDCGVGLGSIALGTLFARDGHARPQTTLQVPHHTPRAKNVIFLCMGGGPSQLDLFEDKPALHRLDGKPVPHSFVKGKRFAFIDGTAKLMASPRRFHRCGDNGAAFSELVPHMASIIDDMCLVRGMKTDIINHGPAKLFMTTGSPRFGRPAMGSWVTYGLGSETRDLPGFCVLVSGARGPNGGSILWSSGFLPRRHQGVAFNAGPQPIWNLNNPPGISNQGQGDFFEAVRALNEEALGRDPHESIRARIESYELAHRMQSSAPELTDLRDESRATLELYGIQDNEPSFARNCILARRMIERGVRFVQLYHTDWDHHGRPTLNLGKPLERICREVDQPSAALVKDLKQRGLLEDTLVIWGGEFGRTPMRQSGVESGRDHHIDAYTMWLAGGGTRAGSVYGMTDEIGYEVVEQPVHIHDFHATILHLLGMDHERLTYHFDGRDFRLTDVGGRVLQGLIG